jgi:hypothetical protein
LVFQFERLGDLHVIPFSAWFSIFKLVVPRGNAPRSSGYQVDALLYSRLRQRGRGPASEADMP